MWCLGRQRADWRSHGAKSSRPAPAVEQYKGMIDAVVKITAREGPKAVRVAASFACPGCRPDQCDRKWHEKVTLGLCDAPWKSMVEYDQCGP